MGTSAVQPKCAWRNPLPAWIQADPAYGKLRSGMRETLQVIADRCDRQPLSCGSLKSCVGGAKLARAAGVSLGTLWRHIRRLERLGFIVCIGHLHPTGVNCYGVPGLRGSLSTSAVTRKIAQMVRCTDGVYRQQIIDPGGQMTFFHLGELNAALDNEHSPRPQPQSAAVTARSADSISGEMPDAKRGAARHEPFLCARSDTGGVSNRHGTRVKMTRVTTLTIGNTCARTIGVDGAAARRKGNGGQSLPRISADHLRDPAKMVELHARAVDRGLASYSEAGELLWCYHVAHALRVGGDPIRLFAYLVNRGHCRPDYAGSLFISQADENAGRKIHAECFL